MQERDGRWDAQRPGGAVGGAGVIAGQLGPPGLQHFRRDRLGRLRVVRQVGEIPDQGRGILAGGDDRAAIGRERDGVYRRRGAPRTDAPRGPWRGPRRGPSAAALDHQADARNRPSGEKARQSRWSPCDFDRGDLLARGKLPDSVRPIVRSVPGDWTRGPHVPRNRPSGESVARSWQLDHRTARRTSRPVAISQIRTPSGSAVRMLLAIGRIEDGAETHEAVLLRILMPERDQDACPRPASQTRPSDATVLPSGE